MARDIDDLSSSELRRILREMLHTNSDYAGRYSLLLRVLDSESERRRGSVLSEADVAEAYMPVYEAIRDLGDATDRGPELEAEALFYLQRAEESCDMHRSTAPAPPSDLDDWIDPTRRLTRRDLHELQQLFTRVVEATRLPSFDWEAHWLNSLVLADDEIAPDFPAREAVSDEWAFLIHESGWLASDERIAPGIAAYVGTLMGRAAVLGRQAAEMFHDVYREKVVTHLGVEAAFALTRMELEVIGRARAIVVPTLQGQRVKAYVAARLYDLGLAGKMTGAEADEIAELTALIPTLEELDGEPEVFQDPPPKRTKPPLKRWTLNAGAAARWLHASKKGPDLYWKLSEAVHGGAVIEEAWFANGEAFGVELVRRCGENMRSELTELNAAYLRYATYGRMNAG